MRTTPIREAVFSISFNELLDMSQLEDFRKDELISTRLPVVIPGFNTNITPSNQGNPPKTDIQKSGYIFKCEPPCNRILHLRLGSLSYHNVQEYVPYDTLIRELNEYWELLQKYTQALSVNSVAVRYINFIEIEGKETLKDLVTVHTKHPFEGQEYVLNQIKLDIDPASQTKGNIVVTNTVEESRKGVVIDITVNRKINGVQFHSIEDAFKNMRSFKNDIFKKAITEKTNQKYEQLFG